MVEMVPPWGSRRYYKITKTLSLQKECLCYFIDSTFETQIEGKKIRSLQLNMFKQHLN